MCFKIKEIISNKLKKKEYYRSSMLVEMIIGYFFSFSRIHLVCAKLLQSCPTLCDPVDCSSPGSSVHGFSKQEYWSGLPCPPLGDLPNPGFEPLTHVSCIDRQVLYQWVTWEDCKFTTRWQIKSLNVTMMHNSLFASNIISIGNTWLCSNKTSFTKTGSELYLVFEL